jgi:hypothetical protein
MKRSCGAYSCWPTTKLRQNKKRFVNVDSY